MLHEIVQMYLIKWPVSDLLTALSPKVLARHKYIVKWNTSIKRYPDNISFSFDLQVLSWVS